MPLITGVSFSDSALNSPVSATVLSTDDASYEVTIEERIVPIDHDDSQSAESAALYDTVQRLAQKLKDKIGAEALVKVVYTGPPSFYEKPSAKLNGKFQPSPFKTVERAARANGLPVSKQITHAAAYFKALTDAPSERAKENEVVVDVGHASVTATLGEVEIEESIRETNVVQEITLPITHELNADAALGLVNKLTNPLVAQKDIKRIIILNSTNSPSSLIHTILTDTVRSKFANQPIEVISPDTPALSFAAAAARSAYEHDAKYPPGDLLIFDVAHLRIGVQKADGFLWDLLPLNRTLPTKRTGVLTTSKDNQTTATVRFFVGLSPITEENKELAVIVLEGLQPKPRGEVTVRVSVEVDANDKLLLEAEVDGVSKSVTLPKIGGNLTDYEVWLLRDRYETALADGEYEGVEAEAKEANALWIRAGKEIEGDLPE